ncbi:MAG: DUF4276 family protein [Candidatus Eremiobacterota bacterium]
MKKIIVLVEGQTEERFVKELLVPNFREKGIYFAPTINTTKRVKDKANFKGGIKSYEKVKSNLLKLFYDTSADIITTMIDYYKLPTDFPGYDKRPPGNFYTAVSYLEDKFKEDINEDRFIPYLQVHEFEAYLFSSLEGFNKVFFDRNTQLESIKNIINQFNNPEAINDGDETAPSKRLMNIFKGYKKTTDGISIAKYLGLEKIRKSCNHFNNWLKTMESI